MKVIIHMFMKIDMDLPSTILKASSNKKADVLFIINVLSDNFFNKDEGNDAYSALIEEYFTESGDETDMNTNNGEGM